MSLYDASVPVFDRYLGRLSGLLDRAEAHCRAGGLDSEALLQSRLAPDMLPLAAQVRTAAGFALRACAPLAGHEVPPDLDCGAGLDGLRRLVQARRAELAALRPEDFAGAAERTCRSRAGDAEVVLDGAAFLFQYALPNFFFHLTLAYALLRRHGVPLGKADFDGFHSYPR